MVRRREKRAFPTDLCRRRSACPQQHDQQRSMNGDKCHDAHQGHPGDGVVCKACHDRVPLNCFCNGFALPPEGSGALSSFGFHACFNLISSRAPREGAPRAQSLNQRSEPQRRRVRSVEGNRKASESGSCRSDLDALRSDKIPAAAHGVVPPLPRNAPLRFDSVPCEIIQTCQR
jgi:hypothetical protein